ncbi:uncharacterized protein LOC142767919 [Rhipicephalus microplus]|uniref:uncharacterized protein LOC142767919 n=1 Tax=Rhipicephalus microplus TaxID=6941 RepID=UPI003F6B45DB
MCLNINQPYCDSNKPAPEDLLKMHQFEVLLNEGREEAALSVAALMAGNEELLQKAREICAVVAPHGGLVARLRQLSSSADVYTPRHEAPIVDPAAFQKAEALLQGVWDLPSRNALQPCSAIEWRDQLLAVQIEEVPDAPIMEVPDVPGEEAPDVRVQPPRADISELDPSRENPDTDASRKMRNRRRRRHRRRRYRRNKRAAQADAGEEQSGMEGEEEGAAQAVAEEELNGLEGEKERAPQADAEEEHNDTEREEEVSFNSS